MGSSSKKDTERSNDIARQERERAAQQAAAVRVQQEESAAKLMQEIRGVTAPTSTETMTQGNIATLQPEVLAMMQAILRGGSPGQTGLSSAISDRLLADLNRQPEDVLKPSLDLLRGEVGNFAARRGIVGSGLELEQMGRAGIDLTIKQALAREQLRADQVNRAQTGNQLLESIGASRRGETTGFLRNLQSLEDARRAREVSAVSGGATTGANIRSQGNLSALDRLSTGEGRAIDMESSDLEFQRQQRAANDAALAKMLGMGVGAAATLIPGVGPVIGPAIMGAYGGGSSMPAMPTPKAPASGAQMRAYKYGSKPVYETFQFPGGSY